MKRTSTCAPFVSKSKTLIVAPLVSLLTTPRSDLQKRVFFPARFDYTVGAPSFNIVLRLSLDGLRGRPWPRLPDQAGGSLNSFCSKRTDAAIS